MSNNVKAYTEFDGMPTNYLRTLLSLDISATSGVELEPDAILHILGVIQSREATDGSAAPVDVGAAWKDFNENYRPSEAKYPSPVRAKGNRRRHLKRACITVAAVIILAVGSMAVANAAGFDLWSAVVQWASETFGLENNIRYVDKGVDRAVLPCSDLQDALSTDGITDPLVPTWLPDGFLQANCNKNVTPQMKIYQANYKNGDLEIAIQIFVYTDNSEAAHTYEKLPEDHTTYTVDGIPHSITVNKDDSVVALWNTANCECSILANVTETEMKQIIDSIYRG